MTAEPEPKYPQGISVGVVIMCLQQGLAVRVNHVFYGPIPAENFAAEKSKEKENDKSFKTYKMG